jgi:hypothetical protein
MPTLNWLTREQDLKAAANAEYRLLVETVAAIRTAEISSYRGIILKP